MYRYIYMRDHPRHIFPLPGGHVKRPVAAVSAALLTSGLLTCVVTAAQAAPAAPAPDTAPAARAESLLRSNPGAVQGASGEAYQVVRTKVDANGAAHVRYTRTYQGLRVYGGDFVIHTAPDGTLRRHLGRPGRAADPRHHRRSLRGRGQGDRRARPLRRQGHRGRRAGAVRRRHLRQGPARLGDRASRLGGRRADPVEAARHHRRHHRRGHRLLRRDRDGGRHRQRASTPARSPSTPRSPAAPTR